jgi:hypothetical protein
MNDKIVNITFNIWANNEEEGRELQRELGAFIDLMGQQGRKVTAAKLTEALRKYKNNYFVLQFFP